MSEIKEKPGRGIAERAADAELRLKENKIQIKTEPDFDQSHFSAPDRSLTPEYTANQESAPFIRSDESQGAIGTSALDQNASYVQTEYVYESASNQEYDFYSPATEYGTDDEVIHEESSGYNSPEYSTFDEYAAEKTMETSADEESYPVGDTSNELQSEKITPIAVETVNEENGSHINSPEYNLSDIHTDSESHSDGSGSIQLTQPANSETYDRTGSSVERKSVQRNRRKTEPIDNNHRKSARKNTEKSSNTPAKKSKEKVIKEKKATGIAERAADAQLRLKKNEIKTKPANDKNPVDIDRSSDEGFDSNVPSDESIHSPGAESVQEKSFIKKGGRDTDTFNKSGESIVDDKAFPDRSVVSQNQTITEIVPDDSNIDSASKEKPSFSSSLSAETDHTDFTSEKRPEKTNDPADNGNKKSETERKKSIAEHSDIKNTTQNEISVAQRSEPDFVRQNTVSVYLTDEAQSSNNAAAVKIKNENSVRTDALNNSGESNSVREKKRSIRERVEAVSSDEPIEKVYDGSHRDSSLPKKAKDRKKTADTTQKSEDKVRKAGEIADKVQKTADGIKEAERPIKEKPTSHVKMVKIAASREINQYNRSFKEKNRYIKTTKQSFNGIVETEFGNERSNNSATEDSSKIVSRTFDDILYFIRERSYAFKNSLFVKRNFFSAVINLSSIIVVFVILFLCLFSSSFGLFLSDNTREDDAMTLTKAMSDASSVIYSEVSNLQMNKGYDEVVVNSALMLDWKQILAIYAVKTTSKDGLDVVTMDKAKSNKLKEIVKDMCAISTYETVTYVEGTNRVDKKILNIDFVQMSAQQTAEYYQFSNDEIDMLNTLLSDECDQLWEELLGNNMIGAFSFGAGDGSVIGSGAVSSAGFIWPTPYSGIYVTVEFGQRTSVHSKPHGGMDINVPGDEQYNKSAIAAAAGKVTKATWHNSYGNYIMIDHGNGISTLYAHLYRIDVSVGQTVAQGQHIGIIGNTGNSFGAHLHFEVRVNGVRQNPRYYLP